MSVELNQFSSIKIISFKESHLMYFIIILIFEVNFPKNIFKIN